MVPKTMGACFALIEQRMFKGPWVMGEQYTICDPYLYTLATWLEGDSVDLDATAEGRRPLQAHVGAARGAEGDGRAEGVRQDRRS